MKPKGKEAPRIFAERSIKQNKFSFRKGLLILAAVVSLPYVPVLAGYVPFPAEIVVLFPPWEGSPQKNCCVGFQHSELGDLATQIYPWRTMNSALHIGQAPLWNFHVFMGTPYQAMPMSALFFPPNWLYSFLSVHLAWSLLFIFRAIATAVIMAIFVRRLGASPLAALISGWTFALSGWVMAFQGRPQLDSAMWLPLMFLAIDELRAKPSYRSVALGAVAFALPVLAGHPEIAVEVILVALLYAGYRLIPFEAATRSYLVAFGVAGVLSILLAAVQLLPTLEWSTLITRSLEMRWPPLAGTQSVGFLSRDLLHHPNVDGVLIPEAASYIGVLTIGVLPLALLWRTRRDVLFFAGLAFFCMEIAYGWEPGFWISDHIPVLNGLPNWRLLVGSDFAFAVLAGLAISALEFRSIRQDLRWLPPMPLVWGSTGAAAGALIALRLVGDTAIAWGWNLLFILLSLVLAVLAATRRIHGRDFIRMAAVIAAADLVTAGFAVIPFVKPASVYPTAPVFNFLRPKANPLWRVAAIDVTYGVQFEIPYGLSSPAGYDFATRRLADVLNVFNTRGEGRTLKSEVVLTAPKGLVDLTGTRYFVTTNWNTSASRFAAVPGRFQQVFSFDHVQVFENPDAVPLVSYLPATAARIVNNEEDQLKAITSASFDGRQTIIVPQIIDRYWGTPGDAPSSSVTDVTQSNDEVKLSVTAPHDGLVYFNETYYPGWTAEVDGAKTPVIRANYAFMAVPVSRGHHTVRFDFEPRSFRLGSLVSGAALLVLPALLLLARRQEGRLEPKTAPESPAGRL
jgi:hypothetical protein